MPSTYTPPDVIVTQVRQTALANTFTPLLPVVVVGSSRQIVVRAPAGTYTAGFELDVAIPQLVAGALIDTTTVAVVLNAFDPTGKAIGLFNVDPDDFNISEDGTSISIDDDIGLEYSILSLRNNAGTLVENDTAIAQVEANTFTCKQIDFVSRGATKNGDSFVVVTAPANIAGKYLIYDLVPTGTKVNIVKAELVDGNEGVVLTQSFSLTTDPTTTFLYAYPTNHELTGNTIDATGAETPGVGVKAQVGSTLSGGHITTLFHAAINIPDSDSGDTVVFAPDSTGAADSAWIALVAAAKVGNYFRISLVGSPGVIRDFRIAAINTTTKSMSLVNDDFSGTGTTALASGGAGVTNIQIFEVLHGADDVPNGAGDVLVGTASGVPWEVEIKRAVPGFLELESVIPVGATGTVTLRRGVRYNSNTASFDLTKLLSTGWTATVLMSYEAQRQDLPLNGLIELSDQQSIEQNLGVIHPHNPIALMANMVALSGLSSPTQTFYALVTADETLSSYEDAISLLTTVDVYYVVPATQEKAILDLFANHVTDQSLPQNKHERVCLLSTPIITSELEIPPLPTTAYSTGSADSLTPSVFVSNAVDWTLASPGDVLNLMSTSDPTTAQILASYRILSIDVPDKSCTLLSSIASSYVAVSPASNPQFFQVVSFPYSADQQAEAWAAEASSYLNFRVMMVRPDICELTYTDKTGPTNVDTDIIAPTFYLAALFAGLKATVAPQQPMTNVPIPGITRLFHSNTYFTPEQLNTIAQGGNAIFTQKTRESAPLCRHQLMTDMTSLYTREFSIIVLVDYAAKYLRDSYEPYVGNHVITSEYLVQLRGIGEALIRQLVNVGCLLQGTILNDLYQDPDEPDQILIDITLNVPIPCNKISITLYI